MEATTLRSEWTFAQKGLVVLSVAFLAWSLAGLIAEPSFATGASAPTEKVLGVDFNGIHALSGFLLLGPALFFALRPAWALMYTLYVGVVLAITGVWALLDAQPAFVFNFPNNSSDGIFHLASASAFLAVAAVQIRRDRAER
jgi:hypothetical protein